MPPGPMDTSVNALTAMLETKTSEWPQDLKDIDKLIKLAEGRVDDLSIDIAAAENNPSNLDALSVLRERRETVAVNLQSLKQLRDSRPKRKGRKRVLPANLSCDKEQPAKRTRPTAAKGSRKPSPSLVPHGRQTRSVTAKGARKRSPSLHEGDGGEGSVKRLRTESEPHTNALIDPPGSPGPLLNPLKSPTLIPVPILNPPASPSPATDPSTEPPKSPKPTDDPPKSPNSATNPPKSPKTITDPPKSPNSATDPPNLHQNHPNSDGYPRRPPIQTASGEW
ncbi:hypothetical protein H1R20_g11087, partial [Candolleomyces eurysporus]